MEENRKKIYDFVKTIIHYNQAIRHTNIDITTETYNINQKLFQGNTALSMASKINEPELVYQLLELKADPNIQNENGNTPLMFRNDIEIKKLLLKYGAKPDIKNNSGTTALMLTDNYDTVKLLLEYGANPDIQNNNGQTVLMDKITNGNPEIVQLLLESKADPDIRDSSGNSAIMILARFLSFGSDDSGRMFQIKNTEVMKLLLDAKANPNLQDTSGNTALILSAIKYPSMELNDLRIEIDQDHFIGLLLEAKADINICNNRGISFISLQPQIVNFYKESTVGNLLDLFQDSIYSPFTVAGGHVSLLYDRSLNKPKDLYVPRRYLGLIRLPRKS